MDVNELSQRLTRRWIAICARHGRHPRTPSSTELTTLHVLLHALVSEPPSEPDTARAASRGSHDILATIQNLDRRMDIYENPELLDQAMAHIPLQELHERAERIQASNTPLPCFEDALADVLVKWFKHEYFVWADRKTEKCPVCDGPMGFQSSPMPTEEERKGGADRVEFHACKDSKCNGSFRFARYNDPVVLMRTRMGRCGEFANLFTLFLRAVGLRAQYVWNREDHVWNSYFSPSMGRWIHLDSCEAARDEPLLYSKGWGKRMSYCLAFSTDGALDVSRGYIASEKWGEAMSMRDLIAEAHLDQVLQSVTAERRLGLPEEVVQRLEQEDIKMREWLHGTDVESGSTDHLQARQSGSAEWKEARGEAGPAK